MSRRALTGLLLLLAAVVTGGVSLGRVRAQARAEHAVRQALTAAAQGEQPSDIDLRLPTPTTGPDRRQYAQPYTFQPLGTYPDQTGRAGWLGPRWRLWEVRFADGHVLEADVLPLHGRPAIVDLGTLHR